MVCRKQRGILVLSTCLCLAGVAAHAAAQDPELIVEIEKQQLYEGESVLYRVTLNHTENPTAPELKGLDNFRVTPLGEQSLDSRQITIINGRQTETVRRGRQYDYRLTPLRSGTLTIPAPTAEIDGAILVGREITLRVTPPEDQRAVLLEFTSNRTSVYPMQPFDLALTIAVKDLPQEFNDRDPLSVQRTPPALQVPWLSDDQLPDGVEPETGWRQILEPMISRRGYGFEINNIGTSSVFSLFGDQKTGFHPKPERTSRQDPSGADVGYWEYRFTRTLIPRRLGTYRFGPITLKGTFAAGLESGQLGGRRIFAMADGLDVTVKDVPFEGRPDSYIGAVGSFDVEAELAPTTARVGDPMTLTLTVTGQGTLDDARPPAIASLPGIPDAFRTYDATEESLGGARRFTYSLRPLSTSVTEFPAIRVSYFDVATEKYVTKNTAAIPITVQDAETLSDSEIVSAPNATRNSGGKLEARAGGVFANDSNFSSLRNQIVRPGRWVATWAGMLGCWVVISLGIRSMKRIREDTGLLRRRSAPARARGALDAAAAFLVLGNVNETCESLRRAVTGLVADYANVPAGGLTPREASQQLESLGIGESLCGRTLELLNHCDAARYGAGADGVSRLHSEASGLVDELHGALRKSPRNLLPQEKALGSALVLLGLVSAGCGLAPDLETVRKFQNADQAFSRATSPSEFARVARQYDQIVGKDFAAGAVLYNQGNAWMRAGETGRAIASYRQAERYRPRDPYLAANLQNALASTGRSGAPSSGSRVAGYVFFWQKWLSYPVKFISTTFLLALTLIISVLYQVTSHQTLLLRVSVVLGMFCAVSAASSAWDWHRVDRTTHGVVTMDQSVARKGNSESYEASFTEPLPEGTEFVVLEERDNWLHVEVGDSGTGWLRDRDIVTY